VALTVTFDFGDTTRSLRDDTAAIVVERLFVRTREAKSELAYQVAINIQARLDRTTDSPIPMTRKEERDELWEIVNPLRAERPGDQWLDLLWQALKSARLLDHDPIELIRAQLRRIGADQDTVGPRDAIGIEDRREGDVMLKGSPRRDPDFHWYGQAEEVLGRLLTLPDGAGPEVVLSEFHQ
jgi:hypothetical protein